MKYKIVIDKKALKFISKQPQSEKNRIFETIKNLPLGDVIKMSGKLNLYRVRIGKYRIIYTLNNDEYIINVIETGNRGDIYK